MTNGRGVQAVGGLIGVVLIVLAGCRGDDPGSEDDGGLSAFAAAYAGAAEDYASDLDAVQAAGIEAVTTDPVGADEVYDALREVTVDAHRAMTGLDAPSEVAEEHEALVELLAEQVDALESIVTASRERDDRTLETHLQRYATALATWREGYGALVVELDG